MLVKCLWKCVNRMQTPITYVYGLTLLPHMQKSAQKSGCKCWGGWPCGATQSFKLELACEKGSLKWLACQQICPDLLQDKKLSPLGTVICISSLDLPSNRKKTGIHLQPPQKKKTHTPDSANLKLLILQKRERVSCIIFRSIKGSWPQSFFIRKKNSLVWVCFSIQCNAHQDGFFLNLLFCNIYFLNLGGGFAI